MRSDVWAKLCVVAAVVLTVGMCSIASWALAADEEAKAKHTIKEVMKAHKAKLHEKAINGSASAEEKNQLLDLYISLGENKPKKGDAESWHALTDAVLVAAAKVAVGREDGGAQLKAALNCQGCHSKHK